MYIDERIVKLYTIVNYKKIFYFLLLGKHLDKIYDGKIKYVKTFIAVIVKTNKISLSLCINNLAIKKK